MSVDFETNSYAAFSQATYSLTEKLSLTAGLRYTKDEKEAQGERYLPPAMTGAPGVVIVPTADFDIGSEEVTWKGGIEYALNDDMFLFASVSRGYKAGGIMSSQAEGYDPEYIMVYEVGSKNRFFDDRAQVNVAAYYAGYEDMQVRHIQLLSSVMENAAEATIIGVEVDFRLLPIRGLEIGGSIAFTSAEYDDYSSYDLARPEYAALGYQDLSGNQLARSPEWVFKLGAQYTIDLGSAGFLTPRVDFYWKDEDYFSPFNRKDWVTPSWSRTDIRLRYENLEGRWYLEAFMKHVEDDDDILFNIPHWVSVAGSEAFMAPPRTVGIRIGLKL